ncbi:MAG: site-specific DNA-methyltransferase [Candidatus Woesebacteria bacterium]|nr:MAG: site-specific DNA-methyltransferase [Candidatus Woesebacteria bacterium]
MATKFYNDNNLTIYNKDSSSMAEIKSDSIGLIVTSPPYWDLKNYKHNRQIGLGQSYEDYLKKLRVILEESHRVLMPGRYFAMVIGTRISDGDLKHIPMDVINIFKEIGMTLKKEIIWHKPKGTQGLWQRGTTQFLKSKPFPGSANINIQHEFIHLFQKSGEFKTIDTDKLSEEFIKEVAWSVWTLPVSRQKGHPAPFPYIIPERLIKLYSCKTETILDPFLGSGTTALAAVDLGRKCIGYELSKDYCLLAKNNILTSNHE